MTKSKIISLLKVQIDVKVFCCIAMAYTISVMSHCLPFAVAQNTPSYSSDIAPILTKNCLGCHSPQTKMGGLILNTYDNLLKGGHRGLAVVPGKKLKSPLYLMVLGEMKPQMPFSAKALEPFEIDLLGKWIDTGALGPASNDIDPMNKHERLPEIEPTIKNPPQIFSLSYHPEGHLLAMGRHGGVDLIETSSGKKVANFDGLTDIARAVAFSSNGRLLAAGGGYAQQGGEVKIWDVAKNREKISIKGHSDTIQALAFSPDQKSLVTASYDKEIKLWDIASGQELRTLKDHIDAVYSLAFTRDGNLLLSGSADRSIKIWNPKTGERLYTLNEPTDGINAIALHPSGKRVSAVGHDRTIRIWNLGKDSGEILKTLVAHQSTILHVVYSPNGEKIATAAADQTVKVFDAETLDELTYLDNQSDWVMAIAFSPDGRELAVGRFDGSLSVYDSERYHDKLQFIGTGGNRHESIF